MKAVAIIPARGGSVRLPGKNIRPFFGRPVMQYSIQAAQDSGLFDEVVVSTDTMAIGEVARDCGATVYYRGTDDGEIGTQQVAADFLRTRRKAEISYATVIYPVAPLLRAGHLLEAWASLHKHGAKWVEGRDSFGRDAGQFYMGYAAGFGLWPLELDRIGYVVPGAVDVNTQSDWDLLESEWRNRGYK